MYDKKWFNTLHERIHCKNLKKKIKINTTALFSFFSSVRPGESFEFDSNKSWIQKNYSEEDFNVTVFILFLFFSATEKNRICDLYDLR